MSLFYVKAYLIFVLYFFAVKNLAEKETDAEKKNLYENFQHVLQKFQLDKVDPMEFYLLKSISLFKSSKFKI